jgi:hypothetical protein
MKLKPVPKLKCGLCGGTGFIPISCKYLMCQECGGDGIVLAPLAKVPDKLLTDVTHGL